VTNPLSNLERNSRNTSSTFLENSNRSSIKIDLIRKVGDLLVNPAINP
jgi:hypothetical protein